MNITYLFFYRGMKAQGFDRKKLVYHSVLQPWLSIWGIFWITIFILINGFTVFFDFTAAGFITSCMCLCPRFLRLYTDCNLDINIPLFFGLYFGWKIIKRTKIWKTHEMDFVTGIPTLEETELPEQPPRHIGDKIFNILF